MIINQVGSYVNIPKQDRLIEIMQQGSEDTYVFIAPETIE